jgi:hypothetical protein
VKTSIRLSALVATLALSSVSFAGPPPGVPTAGDRITEYEQHKRDSHPPYALRGSDYTRSRNVGTDEDSRDRYHRPGTPAPQRFHGPHGDPY